MKVFYRSTTQRSCSYFDIFIMGDIKANTSSKFPLSCAHHSVPYWKTSLGQCPSWSLLSISMSTETTVTSGPKAHLLMPLRKPKGSWVSRSFSRPGPGYWAKKWEMFSPPLLVPTCHPGLPLTCRRSHRVLEHGFISFCLRPPVSREPMGLARGAAGTLLPAPCPSPHFFPKSPLWCFLSSTEINSCH